MIYTNSASGLCICLEACGNNTCCARNADNYEIPLVPVFEKKAV